MGRSMEGEINPTSASTSFVLPATPPFHLEATRHWTMNSWDRTQIPKPFATVSIAMGEPFHVAADADDAGLERARLLLEDRLRALEARALAMIDPSRRR